VRQAIAEKISNAILAYRDAESVHLLHFPFPAVTKAQGPRKGQRGARQAKSLSFQTMVAEVAAEAVTHKCDDDHLGARVVIIQKRRSGDLDNMEKNIFDGLKQIAFKDDNVFDYVETVRVQADTEDDVGFCVEILKITPKRGSTWI
jgi:Holliday junction resolvase RusA-like endonuclease